MSDSNNTSTGVSFSGILTIAFIVLKLTDVIDWSWWWVLSPIWIPLLVILLIGLLYMIITNK
jgi:uncharacterized protein (DUF983 family)